MKAYTFHITLYDLAFLGTIFIGFFLALQLGFAKRINQAANRFLSLALATMALWLFGVMGRDIGLGAYFSHWSRLPLQFLLALGPLIYFYVLKITRSEHKFRRKELLHFSPLLLELGVLLLAIRESIISGAATYDTLIFRRLNPVLQLLAAISVTTYLYLCRRLIRNFHWRLKVAVIDRSPYQLRWLRYLITGFGRLWLLWIPFTAIDYFYYHNQLSIHAYYPLYLILAVTMIWIAVVAFLRPEAGVPGGPLLSKPSPSGELRQKGIWLKKAMEAGLFYRDAELSLGSLAETLEMHSHDLSQIVNVALKKNFSDFINEYRIREVTRKMQDPAYDRLTLLGIAFDSGFNSKTTFNRAFRAMTGKSPAEYKNDLKKERPFYFLEPYSRSAAVISCHEATPKWSSEKLNRNYMFRNYLKIAWRNLWRHTGFSLINILGLAVGMTACFLISIYVTFELSYDKFNRNFEQIYRLNTDIKTGTEVLHWNNASPPMGPALKADYPDEVKDYVRIFGGSFLIQDGDRKFQEKNVCFADPSIFNIFTFSFIRGNAATSLSEPFHIVLTEAMAQKYFGSIDVIGKTLLVNGKQPVEVSAVINDVPYNSHFSFDMLMSSSTLEKMKLVDMTEWASFANFTYLLLPKGYNAAKLEAKFPAFLARHITGDQLRKGYNFALIIEPLKDVYMDTLRGAPVNGNKTNIYIFSVIALFILLIACINFINLSTARASERAKEVGIRKVIGAFKNQLTIQFLGESVIISLLSFLVSVVLCFSLLPLFNNLAGKTVSESVFEHGYVLILFGVAVAIGLLAGIYPAIVLTSFRITSVLKGRFNTSAKGIALRKGLVILQFTISIVLIVGTLIVYSQLNYMRGQPLGFDKDQMAVIDFAGDSVVVSRQQIIKDELRKVPGVLSVSGSSSAPGWSRFDAASDIESKAGNMIQATVSMYNVDFDFVPQYRFQLIAGRAFSTAFPTDSTQSFIVNETMVKQLGYRQPGDAIGKKFMQWGRNGQIIGVVKDFHFESLEQNIRPFDFSINPRNINVFTVKIKGGEIPNTIAALQSKWKSLVPQRPLNYTFLNDNFNRQYSTEDRFGKIFMYFAVLAILISCLGLLGLASYTTLQRTREIGIRKVLGATVPGIINMLCKDFLLLVAVAALIAFPIAWYAMSNWLNNFAYSMHIGFWVFAVAGALAFFIAIVTISFQAIKAALANPVRSLRSE